MCFINELWQNNKINHKLYEQCRSVVYQRIDKNKSLEDVNKMRCVLLMNYDKIIR